MARQSRRLVYGLILAALFVAAVGGLAYYLLSEKTVSLTVDGVPETVETRAGTVGELLAELELSTSTDDVVEPAVEGELVDGAEVQVRFARQLVTVIDGVEATHTVTDRVLAAALATVQAPIEGAAISQPMEVELPRSGMTVEIITPKVVTLDDGGQSESVVSTARTVAELLESEAVTVNAGDRLTPVASTPVTDGLSVTITRIRVEEEVRVEAITHDTVEQDDDTLLVGSRDVTTNGVDGERKVTYAVTFTNGEVTSEEQVSVEVTREPVTEVVKVGTKPAPPVDPGVSAGGEAAGLNWAALAECESSGNPKAVNPAGYYGLYQFSLRTWASVGGTGNPVDASPAEQLKRAQILYNKAGVGQWPHCGPNLYK